MEMDSEYLAGLVIANRVPIYSYMYTYYILHDMY